MTAALPERRHDQLLSRVRGLQRSIAAVHRAALDDLVIQIARSIVAGSGTTAIGTDAIRRRLATARHHTHSLMRTGFRELVDEGHRAGVAVAEAGLRNRRRKREAIEDRSGVFRAQPDTGPPVPLRPLDVIRGFAGDVERWAGRAVQSLDPVDAAKAADDTLGAAATATTTAAKDALSALARMSERSIDAILSSRNAWGRTWEEQFTKSSDRVAAELTTGIVLINAAAVEEETILSIRRRIQPVVEGSSNTMQMVAQAEGMRIGQRAQRWVYDQIELTGTLTGYTMHCACIPTSAPDHVRRHLKFYAAEEVGLYVAADGEVMPEPPYGHPGCLCWCVPDFA